jgi:YCII-related domain
MAKYLLAYSGGSMPESPAERQKVVEQWMGWFGELGNALVDGGSPLAPSATIKPGGAVTSGAGMGISGYSIIEASDGEEATKMAQGCPLINAGGTIEVYESLPMG